MKNPIEGLNKEFESRIKLGIMSVLAVNSKTEFVNLKNILGVTDGNLASHIKALEKNKYITIEKKYISNKPKTFIHVTDLGRKAFEEHLNALEKLLNDVL